MHALRAWRKSRNISLEALSASLAVSTASLSRIERNEQWPDRAIVERVIQMTEGEVTANDFVDMPSPAEAQP